MGTEQADLYLIAEQQRREEEERERNEPSEDSCYASYPVPETGRASRTALQRFCTVLKWIGISILILAILAFVAVVVYALGDAIKGVIAVAVLIFLFKWFFL